jgi:hypothetical protein
VIICTICRVLTGKTLLEDPTEKKDFIGTEKT